MTGHFGISQHNVVACMKFGVSCIKNFLNRLNNHKSHTQYLRLSTQQETRSLQIFIVMIQTHVCRDQNGGVLDRLIWISKFNKSFFTKNM